MRTVGTYLLLLCVATFLPGAVGSSDNAYAQLAIEDIPEGSNFAEHFLQYAAAAAKGDTNWQVLLADDIFYHGNKATAARLYQSMLDQQGFDVTPHNELFLGSYARLGHLYITGEHTPLQLARGLAILVEVASRGEDRASALMAEALIDSIILPKSSALSGLWQSHWLNGKAFSIADLDMLEQDQVLDLDQFTQCDNYFSRIPEIMAILEKEQQNILANKDSNKDMVISAYEKIREFDGPGLNRLTFSFNDIPSRALLSILADVHGLVAEFNHDATWPTVAIHSKDLPRSIVVAQMATDLGLNITCSGETVYFDYAVNAASQEGRKPHYLPNFITWIESISDSSIENAFRVRWGNGSIYEGQVKNSIPSGEGVLHASNNTTIRGHFENGVLHGEGEFKDPFDHMQGHFSHGLLTYGTHIRTTEGAEFRFEGAFKHGRFSGSGEIHLAAGKPDSAPIIYHGPILDDLPHGTGQCMAEVTNYPCTFHHGDLVQVADVALFPATK